MNNTEKHQVLIAEYSNMKADIILGKNLELHLPVITKHLIKLNFLIMGYRDNNEDKDASNCMKIAYHYYTLKDEIHSQLAILM